MKNFKLEVLESLSNNDGRELVVYPVLIFNEEEAVLIDTAYPGQYEILKAQIEKHIDINKLKTIIITHHDIDHIGTVKKFKEEFGENIKIVATKIEADYISGVKTPLKLAKMEAIKDNLDDATKGFYNMLKNGFPNLYVNVDETFEAEDILNYVTDIKVIGTPGHTLGHVCLYVNGEKALITGDSLALVDGKVEPINEFYNHDTKMANESLKKLKEYDIERVCCYHGGEFIGKLNIDEIFK